MQHLLLYALKCSKSSAKKIVLKLLQQNTLHLHPVPLCLSSIFWQDKKNKTAGNLRKKKKKTDKLRPPSSISMPLLGNLYKELILEPVKTWRPKAGGALHKVARGAAAIPRDQTNRTWQQFLVLDCPHLGMPSCRNFWVGGYLLCSAKINFTRYLSSRVFSVVCLSCSDTYHIV